MKKLATLTALLLLAVLIVLPAVCSVNRTATNPQTADGSPTPFPVPKTGPHADSSLTADGSPTPFPVPHLNSLAA